jgi:hypothetical protein
MQNTTRRNFLTGTLMIGLGSIWSAFNFKKPTPRLAHHVFFWLKNPDSEADRQKLMEGLKTLAKIKTVKSLHIGVPADTTKREVIDSSYSVAELMFFDDIAGQNTYQTDPIHQKFIENYSHLWEKVIVYDSLSK